MTTDTISYHKFPISLEDICKCYNNDNNEYMTFEYDPISGENHICSIAGNCIISDFFNKLTSEFTKTQLIAGARKSDKNNKSNNISTNIDKKQDILKRLAEYIAKSFSKSPNLYTEQDIRNIIALSNIDGIRNINLSNEDINNIINLATVYYKSKIVDHPLFSVKSENVTDLMQQLKQVDSVANISDYEGFLNNLKLRSYNYIDVTSCNLTNTLYYHPNEPSIPSIIFALFANRLPILFDLITSQDLYMLQKELQSDDYSKYNNLFLLIFRLSDKDYFYNLKGHSGSKNSFYNELSRIILSMAVKQMVYNIIAGTVTSNLTNSFVNIINRYRVDNIRSPQEAMLTILLKMWSYKPTIVLKSSIGPYNDLKPESVFYVEYDINDISRIDASTNIRFGQEMLKYIYYDRLSNKVVLLPTVLNTVPTINANLNQFPFLANQYSQMSYGANNITLRSLGIFVLSIPRIISSLYYNGYANEYGGRLNTRYINIDQTITISDRIFILSSAVCYKSATTINADPCFGTQIAMGTIAIVRTQKGWLRYDPDLKVSCNSQQEILDKMIRSEYNKYTASDQYGMNEGFDDEFEHWKKDIKNVEKIIDRFDKGYVNIDALIINDSEAIDIISRYGTILIYSDQSGSSSLCDVSIKNCYTY
ncbi:ORF MSV164 putative core protein, fowlpox virus P4b homolog (vaccinia A3L), similar to SW:P17355 [Melanoplus sanguinipes entomopoxvirus]|uniref:Virion core protein 4b n=1 Tax=Melanoplus sanguinipes entomopoxvirus TaxID=83191 RepID=Q9YVS8_MSEPV|nr:ORF MSV164 putative core protein, fowlpox virus P4b homolog (vaccinia A3L), similar to SW:P17355 [Melanoplus sanguinipes entomopoxvirus]AAC97680.1 ORF MSV164 putative core protein, fowlpox virus P4b homolog (vaccinia A3L), similar to SW:P17355 [Melanoplus sanguinipes entomopoxvirus 'O']